ncbi:MAG: hypothetical protein ACXVXW_07555 [Mycobacteriaceae bacterium]
MTACTLCTGFSGHHDPIAHGNEPTWIECPRCDGDGQVHDYEIYNLEGCISCPDCGARPITEEDS